MRRLFQFSKNSLKLSKDAQTDAHKAEKPAQKPVQKQVTVEPESTESKEILEWRQKNDQKITKILGKIKQGANGVLLPQIDHNKGTVSYPALDGIEDSITFLENLSHKQLNLVEKFVYNQFLICPEHKASFLVNVRLCCPKCNSIDVQKLHLFEHKICGCIMEKPKFVDLHDPEKLKCPSCNRIIKNPPKELRVPAMWYVCNDCKEKFDDALITFHCKDFDHDFTINESQTVTVYGYALANGTEHEQIDHLQLRSEISKLLTRLGFSVDENYVIKGKSGHDHKIDICGNNNKHQSIYILINDNNESEIDSKIIQILDTTPKIALIIGLASVTEKTKAIASKYNVSIISSQNVSEIVSEAEKMLNYKIQKLDGAQAK